MLMLMLMHIKTNEKTHNNLFGSLILTCMRIAKNIKIAIPEAENEINSGIHSPAINPMEKITFSMPTKYTIHIGSP